MKTLEELQSLYRTALLPELAVFEEARRKIVKKLLYAACAVIGLLLLAGVTLISIAGAPPAIFAGFIGVGLLGGGYYFLTKDYVANFKATIIRRIVSFFDESFTYDASHCISQAQFTESRIFRRRPDRYKGDDLVQGRLGATGIMFSEIHAEFKGEKAGGSQSEWQTMFKGLFFIGDFNKQFKGCTVVLPDTAQRLLGHVGQTLQSWNRSQGELIKLEDPEFEKLFVVYGDDQVEARYILSTSLMKRIVDFKKKTKRRIYLSFVDSKVCVAVSYTRNLFEPRVFQSVLEFAPIQAYFNDLSLAVGLVEDLKLNTRIWSKQQPPPAPH